MLRSPSSINDVMGKNVQIAHLPICPMAHVPFAHGYPCGPLKTMAHTLTIVNTPVPKWPQLPNVLNTPCTPPLWSLIGVQKKCGSHCPWFPCTPLPPVSILPGPIAHMTHTPWSSKWPIKSDTGALWKWGNSHKRGYGVQWCPGHMGDMGVHGMGKMCDRGYGAPIMGQ